MLNTWCSIFGPNMFLLRRLQRPQLAALRREIPERARGPKLAREARVESRLTLSHVRSGMLHVQYAKVDYGHVEQEDLDVQLQLRAADAVARRVVSRRRNHCVVACRKSK